MTFDRVLERDARVSRVAYHLWIRGVLYENASAFCEGYFQQTQCNRTKKFVPGVFSVNPISTWKKSLLSVDMPVPCIVEYYNTTKKLWEEYQRFDGNVLRHYVVSSGYDGYYNSPIDTSRVLISAAGKLNRPQADVALMVAESSETMAMLSSSLQLLKNPIRRFRKLPRQLKMANPKRIANYLSQKWLEYRYGITPLLMDIDDIRRTYQKGLKRTTNELRKESSMLGLPNGASTSDSWYQRSSPGYYRIDWRKHVETDVILTSHVYYKSQISYDTLGFALENIPMIMWELVPYSFVVDWFMNIGPWIQAVTPKPGIEPLGYTIGVKRKVRYYCFVKNFISLIQSQWRWRDGNFPWHSFTDYYTSYQRITGSELPSFTDVTLLYGLDSLKRIADSASLSWQQIARKLKR